uniref:BTB domain-containing protein n=1 Tax=Glossina morsitans morsitans TaxID=37546 RepID=A0A1B0G520_GLOMM
MDDEFKLCWKNFQDNIASGFQNLYDRGDLVDVTLACDGKLLHAHKFVLAICSPYFQEIFITNPCKHPIKAIDKDTTKIENEFKQKELNTLTCYLIEPSSNSDSDKPQRDLLKMVQIGQRSAQYNGN